MRQQEVIFKCMLCHNDGTCLVGSNIQTGYMTATFSHFFSKFPGKVGFSSPGHLHLSALLICDSGMRSSFTERTFQRCVF